MARVILLHERAASFETLRLAETLADRLDAVERVSFVRPQAALVYRRLTELTRSDPQTIVHAFGGVAFAIALLLRGVRVAYTAPRPPTHRDIAWVRAAARYRAVTVICDSDAERRRWVVGGIVPARCVLVRPGVSLAIPPAARAAAREQFDYAGQHRVVFTAAPPSGPARPISLWTGSILHVLDPNSRHLIWNPPGGGSLESLRSRLIDPTATRVFDAPTPEAGFAAADLILLPSADRVSPAILAMAMASGRPIVGRATPQVCEMLEDRHTALLTAEATPRALATRVCDLLADGETARKNADRARAETYDFFLTSRLVNDYRNVYASLAAAASTVQTA